MPDVAESLTECLAGMEIDVIVISGDLTQRARTREFEAARIYLSKLSDLPIVVVPGNHDIPLYNVWKRFARPQAGYQEFMGDFPDSFQGSNAMIVGLNSVDPYRSVVNGRVSTEVLDACARRFGQVSRTTGSRFWRVVALHHHLLPPPGWERRKPMPKARRLLERLHEMEVDLVLSGHLHRAYVGNTLDVHPRERQSEGIVVVQCGTSTSRRGRGYEREKNSFNVVSLSDVLHVEHWMYFSGGARSPRFSFGV